MSLFWPHCGLVVLARVVTKIMPDSESGCFEWTGAKYQSGYGQYDLGGRQWRAHRLVWSLLNGPIPKGLVIMHSCDNPICVRPEHLSLGTHRDNVLDKIRKERHRGGKNSPGCRAPRADTTLQ